MTDEISHAHIVGRTRCGKSRAIEGWFLRAVKRGEGAILVDPHGDLFNHLVSYLALAAAHYPRLAERVVIVNPLDPDWSVGFNPLELFPGEAAERKATFLTNVITTIFHDDPAIVVRMQRVMRYSFHALMELHLTLVELPRFLTDKKLRDELLADVQSRSVHNFWRHEFPSDKREAEVWMASTLHRLDPLISDPDFRLMFGQQKSTTNLRAVMDTGKIFLVNAPKGQLTEAGSRLLGAFLVAQIQQAAMTRVDMPERERRICNLFVDEAQNFVSVSIRTLLEESGKYRVRAYLAHQHLQQFKDEDLRAAILSQCADTVCFTVGEDDASVLARKIFRPSLDQTKEVTPEDQAQGRVVYRPLQEIWELTERELTELPPRFFWHKAQNREAVLCRSFDMPNVSVPQALIQRLADASGSLYARPKQEARELIETRNSDFTHTQSSDSMGSKRHGNNHPSKRDVLAD
jgi:hypothetical protein